MMFVNNFSDFSTGYSWKFFLVLTYIFIFINFLAVVESNTNNFFPAGYDEHV